MDFSLLNDTSTRGSLLHDVLLMKGRPGPDSGPSVFLETNNLKKENANTLKTISKMTGGLLTEKTLKRRWNATPRPDRAQVKKDLRRLFGLLKDHAKNKMNLPEEVLKVFEKYS